MKKITRISTILLAFMILLTSQAFAATSAMFGSNNYCTVTISRSLMNSKKYKTATVKITTHDLIGWKSSGVINITLTDGNGNYIGTYKKNSGNTIKLGNDHSSYRIYISEYSKPGNSISAQSFNWNNSGKCHTWKVTKAKNCTIK